MKRFSVVMLALCLVLATAVSAMEAVPTAVVSENRDGRQLIIKTYALAPDDDPAQLKEEPFEQEGFLYSFVSMTKNEIPFEEEKICQEVVTVETATRDLSDILAVLAPTIPYDDGRFTGTLALDHTSLVTEATGYTIKSLTVTETKSIEGLDRNDPSYVPDTTVKDGKTLTLSNVEWAVQGTSLAGDTLVPTQFMAVATYSGKTSYKVATGYATTATYTGEVSANGIAAVSYTITYLGEAIVAEEPPVEALDEPSPFPWLIVALSVAAIVLCALIAWLLLRRNTTIYRLDEHGLEYERIGRARLGRRRLFIDLRKNAGYLDTEIVVEIERRTARRLFGRLMTIRLPEGARTHVIRECRQASYWFTINMESMEDIEV